MQIVENWKRRTHHKRLADLGEIALGGYGITQTKLKFISDTENVVFQVKTPSQTYALRIHSPDEKPASQVKGELYWLSALRRETTLQVPEPVLTANGDLVQTVSSPDMPDLRPIVLFHWLPGEVLIGNLNTDVAFRLGGIMAQLHNHSEQFVLPEDMSRPPWEDDRAPLLTTYLQQSQGLSEADLALCLTAINQSSRVIAKVDKAQNYGLIHCDIHAGNCLLYQDEIRIIDFDDCRLGSFVEDIAITVSSFDEYEERETLSKAFLNGYTQVRPLPPNFETEVEAFISSRALGLISWVLSWPTPKHQPFGPILLENSLQRVRRYVNKAQ